MDQEEDNKKSQSSAGEATPLISKKDLACLYTTGIKLSACASGQDDCGQDSAAARTLRTRERDESSSSAVDETLLGADISRKRRETEGEELAEEINSYEGMANVVSPALGCGLFYGIWFCLCHCLSTFMIQFPLHVLLLPLPISSGFMGARYMTECPMNTKLPYGMMVVGVLGTFVLLVRLALLLHVKLFPDDRLKKWLKKGTKVLECVFLISLIFELCFAYEKSPSFVPLSPSYCNETFYRFVCAMNNVLITLVVVWIFLYCVTRQRYLRRSSPP